MPSSSRPEAGKIAIIGGSGLYRLGLGTLTAIHHVDTPYGETPVAVEEERLGHHSVLFLARHGSGHKTAPHRINYRANIRALQQLGVDRILALYAVGGISPGLIAGRMVIPQQLIDYTWGREQTFFTGAEGLDQHTDFTHPYDAMLSQLLAHAARRARVEFRLGGIYGCTQGPRLETAAEIRRMAQDGCDIVGMTGMPEAALAREAGLRLAPLAMVVNRAAGLGENDLDAEAIKGALQQGVETARKVMALTLAALLKS